tara:strand:+ start:80 stop:973 length:894 start_codon:yes stop_codon:yes gene_type:complete
MLASNYQNNDLVLGIDGGGSKCKTVVLNKANDILGTGISGPGNPLHGFEQATHSITQSAQLALKDAGLEHIKLSELVAGVGLAGVNIPAVFDQMIAWHHPFKAMHLATDLFIACLGAHNGSDGAVIVSGTGSCGFSCIDDTHLMVGGHGFPQGDKGSGAWFGLQAVEQVLLSLDGLAEPTLMSEVLLKNLHCNNATDLVEAVVNKKATFYGQHASVVFKAAELGDNLALAIVKEGAEYINSMARMLAAQNPPRMSMLGGLITSLKPWLASDVNDLIEEPLNPSEIGSVIFARQQEAK